MCIHKSLVLQLFSFVGRRRSPCRVDGRRRPRSETANEEATELYEIEADINNTGFASTAASGVLW